MTSVTGGLVLSVNHSGEIVMIDTSQFIQNKFDKEPIYHQPSVTRVQDGSGPIKSVIDGRYGRGSLLLSNRESEIVIYEVLEPFVQKTDSPLDVNKWRVPTLIVSIFGVFIYQYFYKPREKKDPQGPKGASELLEDLKKHAFKGGRVPFQAKKDLAEIESMLKSFDKTSKKLP